MISRKLSIVFVVLASLGGAACAASGDDGASGNADLTAGREGATCGGLAGITCGSGLLCKLPQNVADATGTCVSSATTVTGAKADRLLAALGGLDAVDNAMGGRASADVSTVACITSSNANLDDTDPLFNVPITTCSLQAGPGFTPPQRSVTDDPPKAGVLFDALAAAASSSVDSGMGKSDLALKAASCEGHGPGAGDDPANPPPTTVKCTLTTSDGKTASTTGARALRIAQGFGLAGARDQAMGGVFGTNATNLSCERRSNAALDDASPSFEVPAYSCTFTAAGFDPSTFKLDDAEAKAHELSLALTNAGLQADASSGGKSGVTASKISCAKGPGAATSCTLDAVNDAPGPLTSDGARGSASPPNRPRNRTANARISSGGRSPR